MTSSPNTISQDPAGPIGKAIHWCIRFYQKAMDGRPSPCRFVPSCSSYALEAVEVHGAIRGSALGVRRICRCHPWGSSGLDPVPRPKSEVNAAPGVAEFATSASASSGEEVRTCST